LSFGVQHAHQRGITHRRLGVDETERLSDGSRKPVSIELDHFFILVSAGASEGERLISFGLSEGASNTHPGQGTACRRFFFHNAYLELLWCDNAHEAQSKSARETRLWDRWIRRGQDACPFGFIFRPGADALAVSPPFPCWDYRPAWLPPNMSIAVGSNATVLAEPLLFYLPAARRPDRAPAETRQPLFHGADLQEMSRLECVLPTAVRPSLELQSIIQGGPLIFREGEEYRIEVGFDGESRKGQADFRPGLPIVLRW